MAFENKPLTLTQESPFEAMLDATCERLWEKKVQYSIQRIKEMDEELLRIEEELGEFLNLRHGIKQTLKST